MPLSDEGREAIQQSNRRRNSACGRCGATTEVVDADRVGGFPGIQYRYCGGCGWSRPITRRPTKSENLKNFRGGN